MPNRSQSLVSSAADWRRLIQGVLALYRLRRRAPPPRSGPGRPLQLLLVGYNSARNTGADLRVHEMICPFLPGFAVRGGERARPDYLPELGPDLEPYLAGPNLPKASGGDRP